VLWRCGCPSNLSLSVVFSSFPCCSGSVHGCSVSFSPCSTVPAYVAYGVPFSPFLCMFVLFFCLRFPVVLPRPYPRGVGVRCGRLRAARSGPLVCRRVFYLCRMPPGLRGSFFCVGTVGPFCACFSSCGFAGRLGAFCPRSVHVLWVRRVHCPACRLLLVLVALRFSSWYMRVLRIWSRCWAALCFFGGAPFCSMSSARLCLFLYFLCGGAALVPVCWMLFSCFSLPGF